LTGGFTNLYIDNICLIEKIPNFRKTIDRTMNLKTFRYHIDKTAIFIGSEGVSNYHAAVGCSIRVGKCGSPVGSGARFPGWSIFGQEHAATADDLIESFKRGGTCLLTIERYPNRLNCLGIPKSINF
jgi:hypothetical protein